MTCWRKTNTHRVVAKFPAEDNQEPTFRIRGEWVVWRYRAGQRDRMGSINARTERHGPTVDVPVPEGSPFRLDPTGGPVAQDVGDASVMQVYIASNGYYAWPVSDDVRLDVGAGVQSLSKITIRGTTLRWVNNGTPNHSRLGRS